MAGSDDNRDRGTGAHHDRETSADRDLQSGDHRDRIGETEARQRREDPRFAGGLGAGRPYRPRAYRRVRPWLLLALAMAVLGTGIALPDGLLIATGLVLAGIAGELFDPKREERGRRTYPPP